MKRLNIYVLTLIWLCAYSFTEVTYFSGMNPFLGKLILIFSLIVLILNISIIFLIRKNWKFKIVLGLITCASIFGSSMIAERLVGTSNQEMNPQRYYQDNKLVKWKYLKTLYFQGVLFLLGLMISIFKSVADVPFFHP